MRTARIPRRSSVYDQLALRLREMVRDVHVNELSGVERFQVVSVNPLSVAAVDGELTLQQGDPDFTIGAGLMDRIGLGAVAAGDLLWGARNDQEWHVFDKAGTDGASPLGFPPSGPAGGDLGGNYPNPSAVGLQGRAVSGVAPGANQGLVWTGSSWAPAALVNSFNGRSGAVGLSKGDVTGTGLGAVDIGALGATAAMGGDLDGNAPNPTVRRLQGGATVAALGSLPGSPRDGELCHYLPADGFVWTFRYRAAATSAHKWEFVGGPEYVVSSGAVLTPANTVAWTSLGTNPQVVVPFPGDYVIEIGCDQAGNHGTFTGIYNIYIGLWNATAGAQQGVSTPSMVPTAAWGAAPLYSKEQMNNLTQNTTLQVAYKLNTNTGNQGITNPWLSIKPIRVG